MLAYLRTGETFADLAAGFAVSTATAWRYVHEAVALLSARPPELGAALRAAKRNKLAFVVLDGTLIPIDRVAAGRPFYSGKAQEAWHEPAGHRLQRREPFCGCPGLCAAVPTTCGPPGSGASSATWPPRA